MIIKICNEELSMNDKYNKPLILTATDKAILKSYSLLCDGLSDYLGSGYEIVLHSLENYEHSAIRVLNGHHTGRSEGAPITDLALHMLEQFCQHGELNHHSYSGKNKKGEPLHSTTIAVRGENGRIIGLLCMNFNMNTPFYQIAANHFLQDTQQKPDIHAQENFVDSSADLITEMVSQVKAAVYSDPGVSAQNKNKEIIHRLAEKHLFQLKDSVNQCADILGISRNTVYLHLRNGSES